MKGTKHLCRHHPPAEPTYLAGQESPLWGCLVTGHLVIVGPQNWQYRFGKTVWNVHNLLKTSTQVCTMFPLLWSLTTNILFDNTCRRFSLVLLYTYKCSILFTTVQCNYPRDCKITHLLHTLQLHTLKLHTFTQLHITSTYLHNYTHYNFWKVRNPYWQAEMKSYITVWLRKYI